MYAALHCTVEGTTVIGRFTNEALANAGIARYKMRHNASITPRDKFISRPECDSWDGKYYNMVFDACCKLHVVDYTPFVYMWLVKPVCRDRQRDEHELFLKVGQPVGMELIRLLS